MATVTYTDINTANLWHTCNIDMCTTSINVPTYSPKDNSILEQGFARGSHLT